MDRRQIVSVLDVDPELGEALDPEARALAQRHALARIERLERGVWQPDDVEWARGAFALLIVDGLLLHEVSLAGRETAELLGPGDVLRAVEPGDDFEAVPVTSRWQVCEPVRVVVLDHRFAAVAGRWPALLDAVVERVLRRSKRLAVQLTVTRVTRVDERLLIVLWQLAERWGRVGADGVRLPLPVTHDTLARLVGARRPSVTTALGRLARLGMVRRVRGGWMLLGDPREQLARLADDRFVVEEREPAAKPAA
jgi:CRP-like cAMP-binding protein